MNDFLSSSFIIQINILIIIGNVGIFHLHPSTLEEK